MSTTLLAPNTYVRALLPRTWWYTVPTSTLTGYLALRIAREQHKHDTADIVRWVMATFNVTPMSGGEAVLSTAEIGRKIADLAQQKFGYAQVTMLEAMSLVREVLAPIYGHQLRVTGWLPGHRLAEGRTILVLTGDPCPSCTENPITFLAGDQSGDRRCLNSEDCGWSERAPR